MRCLENVDFQGSYFTVPFYSKHTRDLRFARRWNDWIAEEDDAELVGLIKNRIEPLVTGTNIHFAMEDGVATIDVLGNHYVDIRLTEEQRQLLQDRINPPPRQPAAGGAARRERPRRERGEVRCGECGELGHNRRRHDRERLQALRRQQREAQEEAAVEQVVADAVVPPAEEVMDRPPPVVIELDADGEVIGEQVQLRAEDFHEIGQLLLD
jgi:hypothetical protein